VCRLQSHSCAVLCCCCCPCFLEWEVTVDGSARILLFRLSWREQRIKLLLSIVNTPTISSTMYVALTLPPPVSALPYSVLSSISILMMTSLTIPASASRIIHLILKSNSPQSRYPHSRQAQAETPPDGRSEHDLVTALTPPAVTSLAG